jgi:hypothetical protein
MKTIETKLYSYSELSDEAKQQVIDNTREAILNDCEDFTLGECVDSLKAITSLFNVKIINYSLGAYNRSSHIRIADDGQTLEDFTTMLLKYGYKKNESGRIEFPGVCGFTGVCYDDDIAQTIYESLIGGESLATAFNAVAERIMNICESELEYRTSKKGILETLDTKNEIYTEDGNEF